MTLYLFKRLLYIIPTLLIVSIVAFILSRNIPNDSVLMLLQKRGGGGNEGGIDQKQYDKIYKQLERDLPSFYCSILPSHYAANINAISSPLDKNLIKALQKTGYPYAYIQPFMQSLKSITDRDKLSIVNQFYISKNFSVLDQLKEENLQSDITQLNQSKQSFYYPKFHWHGATNQYHKWVTSLLKGDFGNSIITGQPATNRVKKALTWTLVLSILTIFIGYLLGIMIGYFIALNPEGRIQRILNQSLYVIYSIPAFWFATMMVKFFTTSDYGRWTNIFPSVEIDIYPEASTMMQVLLNSQKLILPIFCVSLLSVSYIVRVITRSITNEMSQPYITTALSKGLTHSQVVRRHALPNALLPFITQLTGAFSGAVAGFLVIEVIFNIPGVGRLMYDSIREADWNIVFCIIMLVAFATAISYLIGDVIYALVNPKIKFS